MQFLKVLENYEQLKEELNEEGTELDPNTIALLLLTDSVYKHACACTRYYKDVYEAADIEQISYQSLSCLPVARRKTSSRFVCLIK